MDRIEKALSKFHKPYSCAQAVWAAFADENENNLAAMREKSGGRADGNMCGALFAAIQILPENERDSVVAGFECKAGSCKCRELKTAHHTKCEECVRIASEILASKLK